MFLCPEPRHCITQLHRTPPSTKPTVQSELKGSERCPFPSSPPGPSARGAIPMMGESAQRPATGQGSGGKRESPGRGARMRRRGKACAWNGPNRPCAARRRRGARPGHEGSGDLRERPEHRPGLRGQHVGPGAGIGEGGGGEGAPR